MQNMKNANDFDFATIFYAKASNGKFIKISLKNKLDHK